MISCDQCGAGFETAEEYKLHMKMSHQYVCTYCGKGFKSNKGRGVHEAKCKQRPKDQEDEKLVKEAKPEINLREGINVDTVIARVVEKNRRRGYYDEADNSENKGA